MARSLVSIEAEALKLPSRKRAELAQKLIYSLDKDGYSKNEKLWAKEAQRRYEDMASGKVKGIPVEKALRELRAKYK